MGKKATLFARRADIFFKFEPREKRKKRRCLLLLKCAGLTKLLLSWNDDTLWE